MENDAKISQRIVEVRKALGLTQQEFAEGIKVSKSHAGAMELSTRKVPDRILKIISYTYGVNENWLKTGKGDMFEKGRDYKLEEVISNFKKLDEHLQDYVLKQIRLALEYQEIQKPKK
ncbi:MAG: helix-turn-helix transcriptional regulator [Spirochaetaceae bacterium]|nr:helix-turn-helix transcriptional regulator [Spirochaetaceae bacterium]